MSVELANILAAREVIAGSVNRTPIVKDEPLSRQTGRSVYLKAECLQRSGSFKVRGAFNKISKLTEEERARGVTTGSAGNHAQAVALAATLNGLRSKIVLPVFAPLTKVVATRNFGAEVVLHGATFDEAVAHSREIEKEEGLTYIHAFDDEAIIAGQGTIGLEIAEDLKDVNVVVVPIGGGGLISGTAVAIKALLPDCRVIGVQAENVAAVPPSLSAGEPLLVDSKPSIADGIAVKRPGQLTLPIIADLVDEVVTVSEEEIAMGVFHCAQDCKLVVEGAGASSIAAILAGKVSFSESETACAVLAGGNIDGNLLARIIEQSLVRQGRYVIFRLLVQDRPGGLAAMLDHVAETGANVVEVFHQRAVWLAPLGRVGIEVILEVRDADHTAEVEKHLEQYGYHVERFKQGGWEE
ncbi:MAG: threonine ammonia-lyase [Acidobacteria bacterium]|nr:threonine ammonia-lyase [Acidobacteriota bacterium]